MFEINECFKAFKEPPCYKSFAAHGKTFYLYHKLDITAALLYHKLVQKLAGASAKMEVRTYKGKSWNPDKFAWIAVTEI